MLRARGRRCVGFNMSIFNRRKISHLGKIIVILILVYALVALLLTKNEVSTQRNEEGLWLKSQLWSQASMSSALPEVGPVLSTACIAREVMNSSQVKLHSNRDSSRQYYLTIGIPTVARKSGSEYLVKTLNSLILGQQHHKIGKSDILIVIQLGDSNTSEKKNLSGKIKKLFQPFINAGVIDVIQVPSGYYPVQSQRGKLKRKFGDSEDRVKWRSKQVIDYSFLFCYCHSLAKYHLQLEDDVIASPEYFLKLKDFIEEYERKETWFTLDASLLGYIGKVYHNDHLKEIAIFYYLFFDEMPVDWLGYSWRHIKGQAGGMRVRAASLFQHIGVVSSMINKKQHAKELYFDNHSQKFLGQNPPAKLYTDLTAHTNNKIENAYKKGNGFFWAKCLHKESCFIKIVFQETVTVKRITIESGANFAVNDTIHIASLESGTTVQGEDCLHYKYLYRRSQIQNIKHGRLDISFPDEWTTDCFKLVIQKQREWIYLREIDVWRIT